MKPTALFTFFGLGVAVESINNPWSCQTNVVTRFEKSAIQAGAEKAAEYMLTGTTTPPNHAGNIFPHYFSNFEALTFQAVCENRVLYEHPIHPRVPHEYTGGTPGQYRVVLAFTNNGSDTM
ncbi:Ribonuclease/ribotoxin [Akanthomyces lecanii RCEF 1005]|uniref:Ribonuclease/ribotoxin n=1 Tax=Akanthomyces lecanii RCEF 1005 TaxID=1081108 RepID=A0A168BF34_CORDF|nr:Ribonuclease/ribotoxin [Akanthomyces lecanii RCEF 1005]